MFTSETAPFSSNQKFKTREFARFFLFSCCWSYTANYSSTSKFYIITLFVYAILGLILDSTKTVSLMITTFVLVPTNFLPMFNSEILRQLSPLNVIAISFLLKSTLKKEFEFDLWISSIFLLLSINIVVSIDIQQSLAMFSRVLFLVYCCRISVFQIKELDPNFLKKTVSSLIFFLFPFSLIEILGHRKIFFTGQYGLPSFGSNLGLSVNHIDRLWSTLGHPNTTGMFYSFAAVFTFRQIIYSSKKSIFEFYIFTSCTVLVYFTGSRSAALGLLFGLIWLSIIKIRLKSRFSAILLAGIFFLLVAFSQVLVNAYFKLSNYGFARTQTDRSQTFEVRNTILKDTDFLTNLPFFGTGQGTASKYYAETGHRFILENSLFQVLIGFGFLFGLIFILMISYVTLTSLPIQNLSFIFPVLAFLGSSNAWEGSRNLQTFLGILILLGRIELSDPSEQK